MKAFVLTTGEYSEFQIRSVYSTREKAEEAEKFVQGYAREIHEYEIDPPIPEHPQGCYPFRVLIWNDGRTLIYRCDAEDVQCESNPRNITEPGGQGAVLCWAKDEQHAAKIANEQRVQWLARPELIGG